MLSVSGLGGTVDTGPGDKVIYDTVYMYHTHSTLYNYSDASTTVKCHVSLLQSMCKCDRCNTESHALTLH